MSEVLIDIVEKWDLQDDACYAPLVLSDQTPEIIRIIRLLCGSAKIYSTLDNSHFYNNVNYFNAEHVIDYNNINDILNYIFDETPDEQELVVLFRKISNQNKAFYKEISLDIAYLIKALDQENYTESFLYLYRILERTSTAFPLIYIAKDNDFKKSHNFLLGIYDDKKTPGELGMLQKFLTNYAGLNPIFRDASLDITLDGYNAAYRDELVRQITIVLVPEMSTLVLDEDTGAITIPYKDVGSFVVCLRNRTFHNLSSRGNINLAKIGGSESLFKLVVPFLLNWYSFVFIEIAKWQLERASS